MAKPSKKAVHKSKPASKPKARAPRAVQPSVPQEESHSVRTERIKNGYLLHSTHEGPGVKGGYQRETVFHPKKPVIQIPIMPPMPMQAQAPIPKGRKGK